MAYRDLEKRRAYYRNYYAEKRRAYRLSHPEEVRAYRLSHLEKIRAYQRKWCLTHPRKRKQGTSRDQLLHCRYDFSVSEFNAMAEKQDWRCAICMERKKLQVDHNHVTKKVRGLLCRGCNPGLGHFEEDPVRCERAAVYLRQHNAGVIPDKDVGVDQSAGNNGGQITLIE